MSFQESYEARDPVPRRRKARSEGYPRWRKAKRDDDEVKPGETKAKEEDDSESEDESSSSTAQSQTAPPPPSSSKTSQASVSTSQASPTLASTSPTQSSQSSNSNPPVSTVPLPPTSKPTITATTPKSVPPASTSSVSSSAKTTLSTSVSTPSSTSSSPSAVSSTPASSTINRGASETTPLSLPLQTTQVIITSASPTAVAETAIAETPVPAQTSASAKASKQETSAGINATADHTALIFGGIGGGVGLVLLLGLIVFLIRRRFRTHRSQHPAPNFAPDRTNAARSIWGTETLSSGQSRRTMTQFIPPIFRGPNANTNNYDNENDMAMPTGRYAAEKQDDVSSLSSYAVERQDRLDRVRTDLLAERELGFGGGLMKGKNVAQPWGNENVNAGGARGLGLDERERVNIDAGGRWEEPVTVAARNSVATSVDSVPRWRDPVTWARDQARRNDSRSGSNLR